MEAQSYPTVFYPQLLVLLRNRCLDEGVLYKHRRMWFSRVMQPFTLVVHQVLYAQCRRDDLMRGAIVVKLSTGQRQHDDLQILQQFIIYLGIRSQGTTEGAIHIVVDHLTILHRTFHQPFDGLIRKEPDAYISEIEMIFLQFSQLLYGGFLQHILQRGGMLS